MTDFQLFKIRLVSRRYTDEVKERCSVMSQSLTSTSSSTFLVRLAFLQDVVCIYDKIDERRLRFSFWRINPTPWILWQISRVAGGHNRADEIALEVWKHGSWHILNTSAHPAFSKRLFRSDRQLRQDKNDTSYDKSRWMANLFNIWMKRWLIECRVSAVLQWL